MRYSTFAFWQHKLGLAALIILHEKDNPSLWRTEMPFEL